MEEVEEASAHAALDASLEDRIEPWLHLFLDGSPEWGLVDYWRRDGTSYKRHGIVTSLHVSLWKLLQEEGTQLVKLREAIDLVQLVLVVQPSAIVSVLRKRREYDNCVKPDYTEEVDAMTRGVPVELRLRFEVGGTSIPMLIDRFNDETVKALDWTLSSSEAFLTLRRELMDRVKNDEAKLLQLMNRTARASLDVKQWYSDDASEETSMEFFEVLSLFASNLSSYQRSRGARTEAETMESRHTHFAVEKIDLELGRWVISPRVVACALKLTNAGFPVDCSLLKLDFRLIACDEDTLLTFLNAMTLGDTQPRIETLALSLKEVMGERLGSTHGDEEDCCERIRQLLRVIANVADRVQELDVGGLLRLCDSQSNREAVWRGLIEDIISRNINSLTVALIESTNIRHDDAPSIERCATEWRAAHPDKKLGVKRLRMRVELPINVAIRSLLSAFDENEEISVVHSAGEWPLSQEIVDSLIAFPNLRKLQLNNATVATMDIFDPTVVDASKPAKPVLEELELKEIVLHDVPSLRRFFERLNPLVSTSPLTKTLQKLHVTQRRRGAFNPEDFYSCPTVAALTEMLQSNSVLRDVMVTDVGDESITDQWALLFEHGCRYLPAPTEYSKPTLAKCCKTAFLSLLCGVSGDSSSARSRIDPSLVRLIFDFSAPMVSRTIHKESVR